MQSQVVDAPQASRFEIRVGEQLAGFVTYRRSGSTWSLLHTEIRPEFEGQGIGSALARGVLDAARDDGAAVLPFCPSPLVRAAAPGARPPRAARAPGGVRADGLTRRA